MRPFHRDIPALLAIDVEPDGFQAAHGGWDGFDALLPEIDRLRRQLSTSSRERPSFTWYVRTDPQVAALHGRPDHVAVAYGDTLRRLASAGDTFGVHVHPLRWSPERDAWVHEFADRAWTTHCIDTAFEAHTSVFGASPERHRYGAGFVDDHIVGMLEARGVRIDNTPEPGSHARRSDPLATVESGIDGSARTAPTPDCRTMPRRPYRPSRDDFLREATESGRNLVVIPMSSTSLRAGRPLWRQAASTLAGRRAGPRPIQPSMWHRAPTRFWDQIELHLLSQARPYLSLGIRTDAPGTPHELHTRAILDALPHHRIARRLRFVDPLELAADRVPADGRQAPASTSLAQR